MVQAPMQMRATEPPRPLMITSGRTPRTPRTRRHRPWPGRLWLSVAACLLAGSALGPAATVGAVAPAAQPAPGCAIPDAQPAVAPTATAASSPAPIIIAPVRRGVSTPVAEILPPPTATPVATADPLAPLTAELTEVTYALAACLSDGEAELVATLVTERYLGQLYAGDMPLPRDDYLALAAELDPVPTEIRTVTDVATDGDDRATAAVTSVVGRQLLVSRWTYRRAPASEREGDQSRWQVEREEPLPFEPPADAPELAVTIADYSFSLDETTVTGPDVVLAGRNSGDQDHELLVLRLDDGLTTQDLLRGTGPGLPDGVAYIGQATVPVAERVDLVLVDLEPGTYTLVCLFLTPDGIPHLALGMEAAFTVAE